MKPVKVKPSSKLDEVPPQEDVKSGEEVEASRLNDYDKPFTQDEVQYGMTASEFSQRCATCRFFKQKNIYDPCLLVRNDAPYPIVEGGYCNQYNMIPDLISPEWVLITGDDLDIDVSGSDDDYRNSKRIVNLKSIFDWVVFKVLGNPVTEALESVDLSQGNGFKIFKVGQVDYWLGWYSNNFEDKEGDIFAEVGFDIYNENVNSKLWPLPELWCMHQSYLKHGKALKVFRIGHFQFALGVFDDPKENPLVPKFIKFYKENPMTMSHGFFYNEKDYRKQIFYKWQTFEVSSVKVGREANAHFTKLELLEDEDMKLQGKDREFVESIIGKDTLDKLESSAESRGKLLEKAGVAWKTGEVEKEAEPKEADKSTDPSVEQSVFLLAMKNITDKSEASLKEAADVVKIATAAVEQIDARVGAIETDVTRIKDLLLKIINPAAASKSPLTSLDPDDPQAKFLLQKNQGSGKESGSSSSAGKRLSIIGEIATMMGDDPALYEKS